MHNIYIYICVYHPPHNRPISQNFPKILSSKRCTAVTNPSTYQPRSRNEGGAVPFRSATTAFRVAKYLAVSKNRKTITKYHNVVPCLQADQFNGQNPAWNMLPPNVHILIARKRVYLLCSIGIFCTDIPRQVGDERYYSNTTTVSQNHSIFPFKIPSFLPHNFKHSWDPIPKATTGQRIRLDTLYLTLLTSSQG